MKHLFNPQIFKSILALLALALFVKILWFSVQMLWLPSSGIDQMAEKGAKPLYYRVKLTPNQAAAPTVKKPTQAPVKHAAGSIKDIKLLAIYNASDITVVTIEHKSKTKVLSRGDEVNGFVLQGAGINFATFSKKSRTYKVMLLASKGSSDAGIKARAIKSIPKKAKVKSKKAKGNVTDAGDHKVIDRSLMKHYAENMDDIYKNIGISEVKNGKDLAGFRITFVRKDSPFAKLGVERDDVIKSINGQEINSYNAAFGMYKNIQNVDNLTLVIERGKEEMELEYEIN